MARLLGMTLVGAWLDRQPPVVAALGRLLVVIVIFGLPVVFALTGALTFWEAWWWLWVDALVVGFWAIVALSSWTSRVFFTFHYLIMFTGISAIVMATHTGHGLPRTITWWSLAVFGVVSFIVHGWQTRGQWYPPAGHGSPLSDNAIMTYPYLRLAVVYFGVFVPITVPGSLATDPAEVDPATTLMPTVVLMSVKLVLELLLALINLGEALRKKG